jgi:secondary thiamine-phosphate synthase enzyme
MNFPLTLDVDGRGLHDVTHKVQAVVDRAGLSEGLVTIFVRHTSASVIVQENADPAVRRDLEAWMDRLVPEHDPLYTHTEEGPDDMPAHIKSALTATSVSVPVMGGRLALGTWQAIYLWEHRRHRARRELVVSVIRA